MESRNTESQMCDTSNSVVDTSADTKKPQSISSGFMRWDSTLAFMATIATFLGTTEPEIHIESFSKYREFHDLTWVALKSGYPPEADSMEPVYPEHVQLVVGTIVQIISAGLQCHRQEVRRTLIQKSAFQAHSEESINRTIDLALRLWLTINIRDDEYCPAVPSLQWDDHIPLDRLIATQFPRPRLIKELYEKMVDHVLPDNFNMVKLKQWSAIRVDWTFDFSEHLDFDKDARILKVFPLKEYVNGLRRSGVALIPDAVIDEYTKTINLLFPSWDLKTQKLLRKSGQTFGLEGPTTYPGPVYLSDLYFWRDRMATLYTEFCSPPPSMTQLFTDRRNTREWLNFWWFGVLIVGLTIIFGLISSVTACLSTVYTYQALALAREVASTSQTCSCILPAASPLSAR